MRLFATGAMEWVMKKALPDDVPIGDKMVTKAIERAQNTVEQRNAETRKNVLKYDEVMNEQRKVIYARRNEILNGEDLKDETSEFLALEIDEIISSHCSSEYQEDWDLDALVVSLGNLWPNEFTPTSFKQVSDSNDIYELTLIHN